MKRILLTVMAIALCLSVFAGCQHNCDPIKFDFSYTVEKDKYVRGETVKITATVTNVSGRTHRYVGCSGNDFIPSIELYTDTQDNEQKYFIPCDPLVFPTDVVNKKVKNGESGGTVYEFNIPEDAKLGNYSITLSYGDDKKEFSDILSIVELTAQNMTEKYSYSSAIVSSASGNIQPIKTLVFATEYSMDGEALLNGCGDGSYRIFSDPETDQSDFPTLVADSEISPTQPTYSKIGNPRVYDTNYEEYKYSHPGWVGLHLLPVGEYIIVFYENTDSRNTDSNAETYWQTQYENIFRLIVPQGETGEAYHSLSFNDTDSLASDYDTTAKYRAGERVEIRLQTVTEQYYKVLVNGEEAVMINGSLECAVFAFIMPDKEVEIEITTVPVDIPDAPQR